MADERRLVPQREIEQLIGSMLTPAANDDTECTPNHAVMLWIGRQVLLAVVEDNIAHLARSAQLGPVDDDQRDELDAMIRERQALLRWVEQSVVPNICVGLTLLGEDPEPDTSEEEADS